MIGTVAELLDKQRGGEFEPTSTDGDMIGHPGGSSVSRCTHIATTCVRALLAVILWMTRDVMDAAAANQEPASSKSTGKKRSRIGFEDVCLSVSSALTLRDMLSDVLETWMVAGDGEEGIGVSKVGAFSPSPTVRVHRYLRRTAFRLLGDLRMIFPLKLKLYKVTKPLAWTLPQSTVSAMRQVFEEVCGSII